MLARQPPPEAAVLIDADGQHPASAIPALLEAASSAELVIGDRFDDLGAMPLKRRLANQTSRRLLELTTGHRVRDTQSGFRVLRGRALALPISGNGYEAESRHLKSLLVRDVDVAWVPIPAIYGDERSGFRRSGIPPASWRLCLVPSEETGSREADRNAEEASD